MLSNKILEIDNLIINKSKEVSTEEIQSKNNVFEKLIKEKHLIMDEIAELVPVL